ncbi:MAG: CoA ester lyase [Actinobacteria bacterium]|nr:CoA ester lyase [Actinomycetota bacterium]
MTELPPLTWLYVPADRPDRVVKALASGAHAVIVDLEDAVAPGAKAGARDELRHVLAEPAEQPVYIRVNPYDSPWGKPDLEAAAQLPVRGVILPKTRSATEAEAAARMLEDRLRVICLIETALGVERAYEIASDNRVHGIALGEADLSGQTGARETGLDWARSRIVNAAVAAGLPRPPQSVYTNLADPEGLARSCAHGRELGFLGRTAIHPRQLPVIEQAYLPTEREAAHAREVVAAFASHERGAFALDGAFVDAAIVVAAEQTVALAERYGTTA